LRRARQSRGGPVSPEAGPSVLRRARPSPAVPRRARRSHPLSGHPVSGRGVTCDPTEEVGPYPCSLPAVVWLS
ncbi:hypothetical protein T484DRAFT_1901588, partial [Baffinella frigidus]